MRSVLISLASAVLLTGCGTVSMVSGQALVETGLAKQTTSLQRVCSAYNKQAEDEHWVEPTTGFFELARTLVEGQGESEKKEPLYQAGLDLELSGADALYQEIAQDIGQAQAGLEIVTNEALAGRAAFIDSPEELKTAVMAYEGALVTAQKSRRNFIAAIERVSADKGKDGIGKADEALSAFNATIDVARATADSLANAYAERPSTASVS